MKFKKITFELNGIDIELTEIQARELRDALNEHLGEIRTMPEMHRDPWMVPIAPHNPPFSPQNPTFPGPVYTSGVIRNPLGAGSNFNGAKGVKIESGTKPFDYPVLDDGDDSHKWIKLHDDPTGV